MIGSQTLAIVWAQWRSLANYHAGRARTRFPITAIFGFHLVRVVDIRRDSRRHNGSRPGESRTARAGLPGALLMIFIYWQIVPIIMVSTGVSLDLDAAARLPDSSRPTVHDRSHAAGDDMYRDAVVLGGHVRRHRHESAVAGLGRAQCCGLCVVQSVYFGGLKGPARKVARTQRLS